MLVSVADNTQKDSLSTRFRMKRFRFFLEQIRSLPRPLHILDIGGTQAYWEQMGLNDPEIHITLLNLYQEPISNTQQFSSIIGDARNLSDFKDQSIDLVFSNSVIEHLFTQENQAAMASEISRVGRAYFIQTPNYYFPIEPHWVFPFFQFFPFSFRVWLTRHFSLGHIGRIPDLRKAQLQVEEVKLLTPKQFQQLFPNALLYEERIFGIVKSMVMYKI